MNTFSRQKMQEQMPELQFDVLQDVKWAKTEAVKNYLAFYHLDFASRLPDVHHGFGALKTQGFNIAAHYWLPKNASSTLVIVHGYYDHVGVFDKAIAYGLSRGFAVVAFDLPGHGLSSGEPGVITSFDQYGDVLADVLSAFGRCDFLPAHFNVLAQSTGCAVVMNYLWRYAQKQNSLPEFDKIALCSPLVLARTWRTTGKIIYALVRHLLRFVPRGGSHSSHDQTFNDFVMKQDTLQSHYLSVQWVGAMKAWHEAIKMYPVLSQSILFIQGTGDMTVDWEYNIPLLQQKSPTASVAYIQNAKHQLLNESAEYRDQVFCLLDQYFS